MSKAEIIVELNALAVHYPRIVRSEVDQEAWLKAYLEDLGELSIEAVRLGCRAWRRSEARKFPLVGELLALSRRQASEAAQDVNDPRQKLMPWRPLTEGEYQALTLDQKIRHGRIMAHHVMGQWKPMSLEARGPDRWKDAEFVRLNSESKAHFAEADRLTKYLGRGAA